MIVFVFFRFIDTIRQLLQAGPPNAMPNCAATAAALEAAATEHSDDGLKLQPPTKVS